MSPAWWRGEEVIAQGAEAVLQSGTWLGRPAVLKLRAPKAYPPPAAAARPAAARARVARALGATLGRLHAAGLVHGDPTTSNFIVEHLPPEGEVALAVIDMSMGGPAEGGEERGVDLR